MTQDEAAEDKPLAVVDIDGVVADVRHRLHFIERRPKDWDGFFEAAPHDPPHEEGIELVQALAGSHDVVFLTGRPEWCRGDTLSWLHRHGIGGHPLVMRPYGDRRPAAAMKLDMLRRHVNGRRVGIVVDDDIYVVKALTGAGYPVRHADWEPRNREEEAALLEAQETEGRS